MSMGVTGVRDGKLFVGEEKLARVHEEKGKELGASLDEIRAHVRAVDLTKTCGPISVGAKVRSFCYDRAEPVRQQLPRESQMLTDVLCMAMPCTSSSCAHALVRGVVSAIHLPVRRLKNADRSWRVTVAAVCLPAG
jgi:hypothetical protein